MSADFLSSLPAGDAVLWEAYLRDRDSGVTRLALPGHKRGGWYATANGTLESRAGAWGADTPVWLNADMRVPSVGTVAAAEGAAASLWGGDIARFSVNGSSAVNQATLLAVAGPGEEVVVSRSLHKSVLMGLVFSGAVPVWVRPTVDPFSGVPVGVDASAVRDALTRHPGAVGVFVGDPSYARTVGDVGAIAAVTGEHKVPLVVDAAWAGHFGFHPGLPGHALQQGADVMVASAHKALVGLSPSALVVARAGLVDTDRLSAGVDATQTTSPPASVLASIDVSRSLLQHHGERLLDGVLAAVGEVRLRLSREFPGVCLEHVRVDPMSLPLSTASIGVDGVLVAEVLRSRGYVLEMVSRDLLIPHFTLVDDPAVVRQFGEVLVEVLGECVRAGSAADPRGAGGGPGGVNVWMVDPVVAMSPREAYFADTVRVPVGDAVGRVCAELVSPYPPGVPALAPGEVVTREVLEVVASAQRSGVLVAYASDPTVETLLVVR